MRGNECYDKVEINAQIETGTGEIDTENDESENERTSKNRTKVKRSIRSPEKIMTYL